MARLIAALIRHGDYRQLARTPSALQPFPLNEAGRAQAKKGVAELIELLQEGGYKLHPQLDSSRLLRAWQTAQIFSEELRVVSAATLQVSSFDDLAERSVGSAANLTIQQIEAVLREDPRFCEPPADWKSNSHYCLPLQGAESLMQAGVRVAEHLETSMQMLADQCRVDTAKVFVGHGAAIRHAAHQLGVLKFEQIARLSMYHCRPVLLERQQQGKWRHVAGDWKVRGQSEAFTD